MDDSEQTWDWPWPRPKSGYDNAGPTEEITITKGGAAFRIIPTGDTGFHSGRMRYKVSCETCSVELHENTTSPRCRIETHLKEIHGFRL